MSYSASTRECSPLVFLINALLPEDEPIAMYPPRGEEEAGHM